MHMAAPNYARNAVGFREMDASGYGFWLLIE